MPRRDDLKTILILGAGPIVIGQAAEFDYSGTQAVKALRAEGYKVVLVNSNPATIMTEPELADATYIEPLDVEILTKIIEKERPDAILPTVGGQTALNLAMKLAEGGVLERYGVEMIGASSQAVHLAEDRQLFQKTMLSIGLEVPQGGLARSLEEARTLAKKIGRYPLLIRPSFTLGGSGGGIAYGPEDFEAKVEFGLSESPVSSVLIEESIVGWKEFELEVMRDKADNFVVICTIENLDPMGVHTGDSITVAPAMTLTDREFQRMRDQARLIMQAIGVETGGSNVQFAVSPKDGRLIVIEMNPRVSRSSALASKATGFPIAKIAALLAVGYTLDEIPNDITKTTVAAFEPSLDYVVTKLPRWSFEKFPGADPTLGPQMRSVGEAMAIGRTFKEALLKGLQSLELSRPSYPTPASQVWDGELSSLATPKPDRIWAVWEALRSGPTVEEIASVTQIDPWFVDQMGQIVAMEADIAGFTSLSALPDDLLRRAKRMGFGDEHLAWLLEQAEWPPRLFDPKVSTSNSTSKPSPTPSPQPKPPNFSQAEARKKSLEVRQRRKERQILPTYHMIDTCAAEFASVTPYLYSSYETESEAPPTSRTKVVILGSGPNRIGQGIEFDTCCVHAALALRKAGVEAIMINCNPETVSTDYDTSDRLYFEPLSLERVLDILDREGPILGVIVQFGGQTPLHLVAALQEAGIPILGTSPDAIDQAEDRGRFGALLDRLEIPCPERGIARSLEEARRIASLITYPVLLRPSYVLGGRAMAIVYDDEGLEKAVSSALEASLDQTLLIDHYLEDAYEIDVDAICDGKRLVIGGIMQHIEEAGVHSGDSACVLPPYKISMYHQQTIREYTESLGLSLGVKGLMNLQYAIKDDRVYVLEVNPRASRTIPFVSKAMDLPLARLATFVMLGRTLDELGLMKEPESRGFFLKEAVLPFKKFPGASITLGPEMRSTGEVMGWAKDFGHAFAKAQMAAGERLPLAGKILISVNDFDKSAALKIARDLHRLGFSILATEGTAASCKRAGIPVIVVRKAHEVSPHALDLLRQGEIQMIIHTPLGSAAHNDGTQLRQAAIRYNVPLLTTLSAAQAAVMGIRAQKQRTLGVCSLQAWFNNNLPKNEA